MTRGLAIGILARVFMRLLSADPEFSWSGSLFIVGLFTVFGTVQGVVAGARARSTKHRITAPVRLLGGFSYLMLGLGAGIVMAPFLWTAGLAVARPDWRRWVRTALAAGAVVNYLGVVVMQINEETFRPIQLIGLVVLLATYLAIAWTARPTFGPGKPVEVTRRAATSERTDRDLRAA